MLGGPPISGTRRSLYRIVLLTKNSRRQNASHQSMGDQHDNLEKGHTLMARQVDRPIAGLLADLQSRGLLDSTIVNFSGEFGRTPFAQGPMVEITIPMVSVFGRPEEVSAVVSLMAPPTNLAITRSKSYDCL